MGTVKRRSYRTNIQRGQAPQLVLDAAHRLFSTRGYLTTSIEDIAAEAGVARPTVFSAVGTKPVILKLVVDHALAGDDAPVPLSERAWWKEVVDEPDPNRCIELHARNMCRIAHRSAGVLRALETAAATDSEAADVWERYQQARRIGMRDFAASLAAKTTLRCDESVVADTLWMLAPDAYLRLVRDAGWPEKKYEAWLADLMKRLFLG